MRLPRSFAPRNNNLWGSLRPKYRLRNLSFRKSEIGVPVSRKRRANRLKPNSDQIIIKTQPNSHFMVHGWFMHPPMSSDLCLLKCNIIIELVPTVKKSQETKPGEHKNGYGNTSSMASIIANWYSMAIKGETPESIWPVIIPGRKTIPMPTIELTVGRIAEEKTSLDKEPVPLSLSAYSGGYMATASADSSAAGEKRSE